MSEITESVVINNTTSETDVDNVDNEQIPAPVDDNTQEENSDLEVTIHQVRMSI